jgi:hypothetical protein
MHFYSVTIMKYTITKTVELWGILNAEKYFSNRRKYTSHIQSFNKVDSVFLQT